MEAATPTRGEQVALEINAGVDARDYSAGDLAQLRQVVLDDLFSFAWLITRAEYILYPPVHNPVCRFVERWGEPGHKRLMVQLPRGIGKTTVVTIANSLRLLCRNPDETLVIFNEREDNVALWVKAMRDIVTGNHLFHLLFRDMLPPGIAFDDQRSMPRSWKWNDQQLQFQRGAIGLPQASITGMGIGAASTGGHWTRVVCDDIIGQKAQESREVMQNAKDWFSRSIFLESPAMMGNHMDVCTPYTHDDVYVFALRTMPNYKLYRRGAIENGESIWESKMPLAMLLQRQAADIEEFSAQLLCHPMAGADTSFQQSWVMPVQLARREDENDSEVYIVYPKDSYDATRTHDSGETPPTSVPLHSLEKWVLVDPAPTEAIDKRKEPGAKNGIVVVGIDPWGRRYLLECWSGRPEPLVVIDKILDLAAKWEVPRVGIEEVNFSRIYRYWLAERAKQRGIHVQATPLKTRGREKDARITAMITPMSQGWWRVIPELTRDFVTELLQYPYGATRDIVDAWAYSQDVLRRPASLGERLHSGWMWREAEKTKDQLTGY